MRELSVLLVLFLGLASPSVGAGGGDPWAEITKLLASDGAGGDQLGWSAALSGDTALIGAFDDDDNGSGSGSAYVFVRSAGVWIEQAKLLASDGAGECCWWRRESGVERREQCEQSCGWPDSDA